MKAWIVDAFEDDDYAGNEAAVIYEERFPSKVRMQSVASELGLPTTAFVVPEERSQYHIRWFTPCNELNICGHATIASACYLYDVAGVTASRRLCFHTYSGPLYTVRRGRQISIDLPQMDVTACAPAAGLAEALGGRILYCGRAVDDILVELESEKAVAHLRPKFGELVKVDCRGHIVTARASNARADFVSRSFFPALGVDEDQVCVSAHCKLGPYWARKLSKRRLVSVQLSPRGGRLLVEVTRDRVRVTGRARVRGSVPV